MRLNGQTSNQSMFKNYLTIAVRSILRNKLFSFINIVGLALSMSIGMIVIMLVVDQMSYDRYNTDAERIYRINHEQLDNSNPINRMATSPPGVARELVDEYAGIESMTRLRRGFGNDWLPIGDNENIPIGGFFADPSALEFFQYELEYGNPETALSEPRKVVLTRKAADKLFEKENPIGEFIKVGELGDFEVSGVIADTDNKSHIRFEALASMSSLKQLVADSLINSDETVFWDRWSNWNYIKLNEGVDKRKIEGHLASINVKHFADDEDTNIKFYLQGLLEINPGPLLGNQIGPGMPMFMVYFLGVLTILIIISACFNYTTLSVARAMSRAREVGVRKASGALKWQVFSQFLSEAIIVALFSLLLAIALLPVLAPAFQELKFAQMLYWDLSLNNTVVLIFVAFALIVGIVAGIFPSLFMSGVRPITVLRGSSSMKLLSRIGLRKTLLVSQFVLSLFLIISTRLIQNQVTMMTEADYGFNAENIINVKLYNTSYDQFKQAVSNKAGIESVSGASHIPGIGHEMSFEVFLEEQAEPFALSYFAVDREYIDQMQLTLLHGSNFPATANRDQEQFIILNESAASTLGFEPISDALGESIMTSDSVNLQILGIVKDYNHMAMVTEISPLGLRLAPDLYSAAQVRHTGDPENARASIEAAWKQVNPDLKIAYEDLKVEIREFYDFMFSDLVSITTFISFLAIFIACMGLLGMAVYTAQTRAREVSIRKVLGAGFNDVVYALSKGYALILGISILIALPLTYFVNNLWLETLAYHVNMGVGTVLFGVGIILVLGGLTIFSQTIKAATANTVDPLRGE